MAVNPILKPAEPRAAAGVRLSRSARYIFFGAALLYFCVPMAAVLLYSFATRWTANVLPDGYTLEWWQATVADPRIQSAFSTSISLATLTAVIDIAVVVPAAYWSRVRNARIRPVVEVAAAVPFALPYVVIAFGLMQFSGVVVPQYQGTFALLVAGHAAIAFPFVYWAVDGAMAAAGIERLSETAEACGASPSQTLRRVVLPNISPGLVTGGLLSFAASFGEFAMAQIIGRGLDTVPLWSAEMIRSYTDTAGSYNRLAVVTLLTFAVLFVLSAVVVYWNRGQTVRLLPGGGASDKGGADERRQHGRRYQDVRPGEGPRPRLRRRLRGRAPGSCSGHRAAARRHCCGAWLGLERPDRGSVEIGELDVTSVPTRDRPIGMVFQNYALFPNLTVRQNIAFPLEVRHKAAPGNRLPGRRTARAGPPDRSSRPLSKADQRRTGAAVRARSCAGAES
jgi:putative spermidine/putrescine transport system permease protein